MLQKDELKNIWIQERSILKDISGKFPKKAKNYITDIKKVFDGWKRKHYFIRDNFTKDYKLKNL